MLLQAQIHYHANRTMYLKLVHLLMSSSLISIERWIKEEVELKNKEVQLKRKELSLIETIAHNLDIQVCK